MTNLEASIINRALAWWRSKRPIGWTSEDHLKNPTVNCVDGLEHALAKSAANVARGHISSGSRQEGR